MVSFTQSSWMLFQNSTRSFRSHSPRRCRRSTNYVLHPRTSGYHGDRQWVPVHMSLVRLLLSASRHSTRSLATLASAIERAVRTSRGHFQTSSRGVAGAGESAQNHPNIPVRTQDHPKPSNQGRPVTGRDTNEQEDTDDASGPSADAKRSFGVGNKGRAFDYRPGRPN